MKTEIKIWPDNAPQHFEVLAARIREACPSQCTAQYPCITVTCDDSSELERIRSVAQTVGPPIKYSLAERFSRGDLPLIAFLPLAVEGDYVDEDDEGVPLNTYPHLVCEHCRMPDEGRLPNPYRVSVTQLRRKTQDGVKGERLASGREMFSCHCGVIVVSEAVKAILDDAAQEEFLCSEVEPVGSQAKRAASYWALRPKSGWGRHQHLDLGHECSSCGRHQESRISSDEGEWSYWESRLFLEMGQAPRNEVVCTETWFGDRRDTPFGFLRDVLVSGRLYESLLEAGTAGLVEPDRVVCVNGEILRSEA